MSHLDQFSFHMKIEDVFSTSKYPLIAVGRVSKGELHISDRIQVIDAYGNKRFEDEVINLEIGFSKYPIVSVWEGSNAAIMLKHHKPTDLQSGDDIVCDTDAQGFGFEITFLESGWFEVTWSSENQRAAIMNSAYLGNDAPRILLQGIVNLYKDPHRQQYLCWHDEPGASIIQLHRQEDVVHLNISTTMKDAFELPVEGDILAKEEIYAEDFTATIPFAMFVSKVIRAMGVYEYGDKKALYEKEWCTFPSHELWEVKYFLKSAK